MSHLNDDSPQEPEYIDDGFYVHHGIPLTYGGAPDAETFQPLPPVAVDHSLITESANPGLPPRFHQRLPEPTFYRLPPPIAGSVDDLAAGTIFSEESPTFPVAAPPPVRHTSSATADPSAAQNTQQARPAPSPDTLTSLSQIGQGFDPLYPFLLYLALGFGTLYAQVEILTRYTILWTVLIGLGTFFTLIDTSSDSPPRVMAPTGLSWGFSIGLVFGLPIFILASSGLASLTRLLYPDIDNAALFQSLVFIGPLAETLFFRGALQERRGFSAAVFGAALSGVLFYWPAVIVQPVFLVAVGIFSLVLAGVYSFIRMRYGLGAAYISQVTTNLLLLFIPVLLTP